MTPGILLMIIGDLLLGLNAGVLIGRAVERAARNKKHDVALREIVEDTFACSYLDRGGRRRCHFCLNFITQHAADCPIGKAVALLQKGRLPGRGNIDIAD